MNIERLNGGQFLIAPTDNSWERQGTSNSGAVMLPSTPELLAKISHAAGKELTRDERLQEYVVVCLYSAVGTMPDNDLRTQRRGLAIFSPRLELCYRHPLPVLEPDFAPDSIDLKGVEDARVTYADGKFFIWYCGYNGKLGLPCCAWSEDLIHWVKQNPLSGPLGEHENKDHVIFPEPFRGRWWMLHRPWGHEIPDANNYVMRLGSAPTPYGPWQDEGEILRGMPHPDKKISWVGGGATPLKIGEGRYFILYHNGCFYHDGYRQYDACACLIDLNEFVPGQPEKIVSHRLEPFMVPQTEQETNDHLRIDIIFPMHAHVHDGKLYFLYGAGDKATCGACVSWQEVRETMGF